MQEKTHKPTFLEKLREDFSDLPWGDFFGLRFIYHKFFPFDALNPPKHPPSTGFLWFIGVYIAIFGLASQRYENRLDRIENRANGIYTQLGSTKVREALERVPSAQNMLRPLKPSIFNPISVYCSFFCKNTYDRETAESLKRLIASYRAELTNIDLQGAYLGKANLRGAVLLKINLSGAYLKEANLGEAVLKGANLEGANLEGANLEGANLEGANLVNVTLRMADLRGADLRGIIHKGDLSEGKQRESIFSARERRKIIRTKDVIAFIYDSLHSLVNIFTKKRGKPIGSLQKEINRAFVDSDTKLPDDLDLRIKERKKVKKKVTSGEYLEVYLPIEGLAEAIIRRGVSIKE